MARYEAGEQQPVLSAAMALADALGISVTQLAGKAPQGIDLTGDWWAGWQTFRDGEEHLAIALGRWVGLSYDGKIITGWAAIAKDEDQVPDLIETLKRTDGRGPQL